MSQVKNYITTGEAAAIFDVDPDTILRWIKAGDIPAIRTPGGHYRIHRNVFLTKMIEDESGKENLGLRPVIPFCWEFNSDSGTIQDACKTCIVYQSRTGRCYELCKLAASIGHAKFFCADSCQDCRYFKHISEFAH
jgi:excisionase family DNA binding protein